MTQNYVKNLDVTVIRRCRQVERWHCAAQSLSEIFALFFGPLVHVCKSESVVSEKFVNSEIICLEIRTIYSSI
jgi:hypothetical protein